MFASSFRRSVVEERLGCRPAQSTGRAGHPAPGPPALSLPGSDVAFSHGDVPFRAGEELVEGHDFGFVELSPIQLEGADAVAMMPAVLSKKLVEGADDQESPGLSM